jgi:hypothetical protein
VTVAKLVDVVELGAVVVVEVGAEVVVPVVAAGEAGADMLVEVAVNEAASVVGAAFRCRHHMTQPRTPTC